MTWLKSVLDVVANVFGFITEFFKRKNEKDVRERKERAVDHKFKDLAIKAIKDKDVNKVRDLLSE